MFIFEGDTELEQGKGREREGDRLGSRLQALSCQPDAGLELTNCEIMTRAEVRVSTD